MNLGCSKASGLQWLLDQMGSHPSEVMAIGDNYNDLEMLQMAGYPVIMGNSTPGLASDGWHLTHSNDQDGVAAAIHSLVLKYPDQPLPFSNGDEAGGWTVPLSNP